MSTDLDRRLTFRPDTTLALLRHPSTPGLHHVRVAGRLARDADGPIRLVDGADSVEIQGDEIETAYVEAAWAGVEADWNVDTRRLCGARLLYIRRPRLTPAAAAAAGLPEASFLLDPRRVDVVLMRSRLVRMIRRRLENLGFVEVQTPVLHEAGEACDVRQAETRSVDGRVLFIRTDPEEYLKRYLTAGLEAVFEVSVNVRLEQPDDDHLQEFTSVECYRRFWTLEGAIACCSDLIAGALNELRGTTMTVLHGRPVDLTPPFRVAAFRDLILAHADLDIDDYPDAETLADEVRRRRWWTGTGGALDGFRRTWLEWLFEDKVLLALDAPIFVVDFPTALGLSARERDDAADRCLRAELYLPGGFELAHLYDNLTDSVALAARYAERRCHRIAAGLAPVPLDDGLLASAALGMPPMAGLALGIDRLVMLLLGTGPVGAGLLFPREGFPRGRDVSA